MTKMIISGEAVDQTVVEFQFARARAIQAYASLEQSICDLFCRLLGIQDKLGAIVFFKITAPRFRNYIIEKLLRETQRNEFLTFWNSFVTKLLGPVDGERNLVVHWSTSISIASGDASGIVRDMNLVAPNFWSFDQNNAWDKNDLEDFTNRAKQAAIIINLFVGHIFYDLHKDLPLREIFLQPLTYPIPSDSPLYLVPKVPTPQHQSSGE